MTEDIILKKLENIIKEITKDDESLSLSGKDLSEDFDMDSLDLINLFHQVEKEFNISLDDEMIVEEELSNIENLVSHILGAK